jgi:two-component system sensor histidine kinase HydH
MKKTAAALLLVTLALVLPLALVWSAWRSYDAQLNQRRVYLRSRLAAVAALLETLPAASAAESLYDEEPGLLDLHIYPQPVPGDRLDSLWQGRELFRLEDTTSRAQPALRGYLPFHADGALRVARIDIAISAADFLVQPARRSLAVSALAGLAILLLSLLSAWAFERSRRAELRQAELEHLAQIGRLSAVLAHEIRNPLGTIKGFAQLLAEQVPTGLSAFVEPILTQTARLEQLVKDLLLYGRPPQPNPSSVPIEEILSNLRDHAAHLGTPGVDFRFHSALAGSLHTDRDILDQALLNLLRNAAEAVREQPGATVSVGISYAPEGVRIAVEDNGPGFTPEAQAALFQPFFTTKAFGTGLGLSTTRNLIRSLGGSLSITAKSGAGALVEVLLPRQTP